MSRQIAAVLLAAFLGFTGRAEAVIGTLDDVPAATLLLPYFEVDPVNSTGITTLFKIRNAASDPVVAHVTVWSNLSVPVLDFDVYLTGFDDQTIDLRDVLIFGNLPRTGPSDFLSPRGSRSGPHNTFGGSCSTSGGPPAYVNPALSVSFRAHAQAWLSGHPSATFGTCASTLTQHLVGYVTIDAVNRCNLLFPSDAGYFASGGAGVASNRNVLWGDWTLVDLSTNSAQADALVHIEASADDPLTSTPGNYTFYGRYTGGTAADNRERLPAQWYAPLDSLAGSIGVGGTKELLVWRDSGRVISAFPCASPPSTFPLGASAISVISQDGAATPLAASSFPQETQRTPIAQDGSWLRLDLNTSTGSIFDPAKQAHVIALRQDTGMGAVQEMGTGKIGTADRAPGASLLLPYFEVDTSNPNGIQTTVAVHNSSPSPVLAHVVLWTDLSVPTLGFDLYLPGLGSRVIDLKDTFLTGSLPASGPSPLPGCGGTLPPLPITASRLAALNVAHMGGSSQLFGGLCAGASHGDGLARGYLTVDVVTRCTSALPGQPGYFGAGGAVGFDNVLWGDYAMVDPANNLSHGDTLVHLQASTTDPLTSTPGRPTFYGRYVAWSAADHREALPSTWGASSRRAGVLTGGASLLVWRDSGQVVQPFPCGAPPAIFPLGQGPILHFDETGQDVPVPPFALGLEAQKRAVDWTGPGFGTLTLELGTRTGAFSPPFLQSYVTSVEVSSGRFSLSIPGVQLPSIVLFMDGFESGNFVAWSAKLP